MCVVSESLESTEAASVSISMISPSAGADARGRARRLTSRTEVALEEGGVEAGEAGGVPKGVMVGEAYLEPGAEHTGEEQGSP